jgi:hypothetical protein
MRWWILGLLFFSSVAAAQSDDLQPENVVIMTRVDAFGLERPFAEGALVNQGTEAYAEVNLFAEVYDADDELIGEGFGFLVGACGEALVADFVLLPGAEAHFSISLDIFFEPDAAIDRVEVLPEGTAITAPETTPEPELPGITQVTVREVVAVEWMDSQSLRYSVGCWRDVFTNRSWYSYDLNTGAEDMITHPRADAITGELQATIRLEDPALFNRSFFSFAPGSRRAAYQTDLNTLVTVEPDGTFPRVLYDQLYNISLQGINWHKDSGTLLAYYHGGFGDEVIYLVANADGRQFSQHPNVSLPSRIVPGFAANGRGVVVATTVEDVTGYFLKSTTVDFTIPMFEAEPPGNNWPAPFYEIPDSGARWIYIIRPVEGEPRLQCYNPDSLQLHDYTAVPLDLATDARAWTWLSPDNNTLALGATGISGGLWLIDLTQFPACD